LFGTDFQLLLRALDFPACFVLPAQNEYAYDIHFQHGGTIRVPCSLISRGTLTELQDYLRGERLLMALAG